MDFGLYFELFGPAIAAALIAGALCPFVGGFLLLRRAAFEGVALPQCAAAGTALGFAALPLWVEIIGFGGLSLEEALDSPHALTGYLLGWAGLGTALGLGALLLAGRDGGKGPARVAVLFAVASTTTTLLAMASPVGAERIEGLLRGEILAIDIHDLEVLGGVFVLVSLGIWRLWPRLVMLEVDPDLGRILGHDLGRLRAAALLFVGATVAVGSLLVGPVVLFGLLTIPPLAAHAGAGSLRGYFLASSAYGFAGAAGGLVTSFGLDWPLGPSVVAASAVVLGGATALRRILR